MLLQLRIIFGLQGMLVHVVLILRYFILEVMMRFHLYLMLMMIDGLKYGIMFLCSLIEKRMGQLLIFLRKMLILVWVMREY